MFRKENWLKSWEILDHFTHFCHYLILPQRCFPCWVFEKDFIPFYRYRWEERQICFLLWRFLPVFFLRIFYECWSYLLVLFSFPFPGVFSKPPSFSIWSFLLWRCQSWFTFRFSANCTRTRKVPRLSQYHPDHRWLCTFRQRFGFRFLCNWSWLRSEGHLRPCVKRRSRFVCSSSPKRRAIRPFWSGRMRLVGLGRNSRRLSSCCGILSSPVGSSGRPSTPWHSSHRLSWKPSGIVSFC